MDEQSPPIAINFLNVRYRRDQITDGAFSVCIEHFQAYELTFRSHAVDRLQIERIRCDLTGLAAEPVNGPERLAVGRHLLASDNSRDVCPMPVLVVKRIARVVRDGEIAMKTAQLDVGVFFEMRLVCGLVFITNDGTNLGYQIESAF